MAADQTNLGRVQGGGIFMSTADSSTGINISTLSPTTIKPMVGDSVIFQNGDVRTVITIVDSVVSCGEVAMNIRGPKGETGETGETGAPFTYDMFTPEQLEALTGPEGPQGKQGEKGEKGDQGPQGYNIVTVSVVKKY